MLGVRDVGPEAAELGEPDVVEDTTTTTFGRAVGRSHRLRPPGLRLRPVAADRPLELRRITHARSLVIRVTRDPLLIRRRLVRSVDIGTSSVDGAGLRSGVKGGCVKGGGVRGGGATWAEMGTTWGGAFAALPSQKAWSAAASSAWSPEEFP